MQNIGFSSRPVNGIPPTGDGFSCVQKGACTRVLLADGMGHGTKAHQIVDRLIKQFLWLSHRAEVLPSIVHCFLSFDRELKRLDQQDAQAAVAIADIDLNSHAMSSAAIGNVETSYFCFGREQHFVPMKGMVGGRMPAHLNLHHAQIESPSIIALTTDGIQSQFARPILSSLSASPALNVQRAQVIAENIVKASHSPYDDASCALIVVLP